GNENRNIADHLNLVTVGVLPQPPPLPEEKELEKLLHGDRFAQVLLSLGERGRVAEHEFSWPVVPGFAAVGVLESHKQGEVRQPGGFLGSEGLEGPAQLCRRAAGMILPGTRE